jgi:flagellar biosynthetic protein FlhB
MANGPHGERTEKPTAKRKRDAGKRGQVARSRDLAGVLTLLAVTGALVWFGQRTWRGFSDRLVHGLNTLPEGGRGEWHAGTLSSMLWPDLGLLLSIAGPPALIGAAVAAVASMAQTGWTFSPKALRFEWNRLSPATGVSRFAPLQGGAELVKALIGLAVLVGACYGPVRDLYVRAPGLMAMTPVEIARVGWDAVWTLLWRAGLALGLVATADYGLQYWRWYSGIKMTRQEVKDEFRANEGNPDIKARVRRIQREMTRRRMIHAVKDATVVITNPTHVAVALSYRRTGMVAPVVVAKGQDEMARRIKKAAARHGVPTVENVALARALYQGAEVGDVIPGALFGAVAEVLAYLVRLKQLVL